MTLNLEMDSYPTRYDGHTYLAFDSTREPKRQPWWLRWLRSDELGVVEATPSDNFALLSDAYQEGMRAGFLARGYVLKTEPGRFDGYPRD